MKFSAYWRFIYVYLFLAGLALASSVASADSRLTQEQVGDSSLAPLDGVQPYKWTRNLPSRACPWSTSQTNCHLSSPTLADLNNDGRLDVVVATNKGHVVAVRHNGTLLWDRDVAPAFGMPGGSQEIGSTPAVGDIDADGQPEIVVGAGSIYPSRCTQGGVIVLNRNGNVEPGWPRLSDDWIEPWGCRDTVFSSPAIGDLDNDGDLEIVAGSFDKRVYAWHHDGRLMSGFPPDSHLRARFPTWTDLIGRLGDTIWSSPALADLDHDGYLDIIIGSDEGNIGGGWSCPYRLPPNWMPGYCGGSIYAFNRFGQILPGFPRYIHETVQSSPAIADLNDDGNPDIIVGTGSYYYQYSPDHPTNGSRLYAFDNHGNDLPGWANGKAVGGPVPASPAVGDITGDDRPEIVVATMAERKLYAWRSNGQRVSGFPMRPVDNWGQALSNYDVGSSFILADYDSDGKMEILFNEGWVVTVVDGNGAQITAPNFPNNVKPIYLTSGSLPNNPAVGDLDSDGELELVAQNSTLYVWDMPASQNLADWPMFKKDAAGAGYVPMRPRLGSNLQRIYGFHGPDDPDLLRLAVRILNRGDGSMRWTATAPTGISLSPSSGNMADEQVINVTINTSRFGAGHRSLGDISVTAVSGGTPVADSPLLIPVYLYKGDVSRAFLPIFTR